MPVDRQPISRSQLCELLGVDLARFLALEPDRAAGKRRRDPERWWILQEPEHADSRHVSTAE